MTFPNRALSLYGFAGSRTIGEDALSSLAPTFSLLDLSQYARLHGIIHLFAAQRRDVRACGGASTGIVVENYAINGLTRLKEVHREETGIRVDGRYVMSANAKDTVAAPLVCGVEEVIALLAEEIIQTLTAVDIIPTGVSANHVVAFVAVQAIVATAAEDDIVSTAPLRSYRYDLCPRAGQAGLYP